ncbi:protein-export chaperone SecB [Rhodovibrionaceae bacterium A322]
MSDAQTPNAAAEQNLPVVVHTQYVKDLSFENPNAPMILANLKQAPQLEVRLDVGARHLQDRVFEVMLKMQANATTDGEPAFMVELEYGGVATVNDNIPEDQVEETLLVDAIRIIFPFARRVVADATRDGGFPPVLINPIDFAELYAQRKAAQADGDTASA